MIRRQECTDQRIQDEELIRLFLGGQEQSFNDLVRKHQDAVLNLCCKILGNNEEGEDAAQDVFVRVYHALPRFKFQAAFSTWLFRICVNLCRTRMSSAGFRKSKRTGSLDQDPAQKGSREIFDENFTPEAMSEKKQINERIYEAIGSLPDDMKVLVVLRDMEGRSYEEIRKITGLREGTVKSRLFRARELLKKALIGVLE